MRKGEVWWANLEKPGNRRPVLLLSRDSACRVRSSVTIAPITRTRRDIPTEVRLGEEDGLKVECVVNTDNITTVPKSWLTTRITVLVPEKMDAVRRAIIFALDLDR